ncbi:MAG TPA: endonuclease/exonuclease/phosphatase family protein [Streptosporangiaceae bacterium]|nr:endonuclease/exonuclease/phosphatase family protein [Streptosporangiaceae bacterium]
MPRIRLLSYNLRSLRGDTSAVVRIIRGLRPDIACLQEVPRFFGRRQKVGDLARRCGMEVAAGRRPAGLAILTGPAVRVLHREYRLLTRVPRLHRRGVALAVVEIGDARLAVASTHLDLRDGPRLAHAGQVLSALGRLRGAYDAPAVLAGDINEPPGGPAWSLLARSLPDAYALAPAGGAATFSSAQPRRRIDGVFADRRIRVHGCGVPAEPSRPGDYALATDHRPVLAELELAGQPTWGALQTEIN